MILNGTESRVIQSARRTWAARVVVVGAVSWAIAGCTGSADIKMVSLHASEIDPPGTDVVEVKSGEAFWTVDEDGDLHVSIRMKRDNWLLGAWGRHEFVMSVVPGPPPNGRARNYDIKSGSTRTLWLTGLGSRRFASYAGVMAVYMDGGGRCHGSFRFWTINPGATMPIWFVPQTPGPTLVFGTFKAVRDDKACQRIEDAAESGGWKRARRAKQNPATTKPSTSGPSSG